jgi:diaminopimelate decarboxylase
MGLGLVLDYATHDGITMTEGTILSSQAAFLSFDDVRRVQREFGTPVYVYDEAALEARAREVLTFPHAFGYQARYAMKALPTAAILQLFHRLGLHIDASSGYEAERAMRAGIPADHIQVTAQELPENLEDLVKRGLRFNACSLHQLRAYCTLFPNTEVMVRINPGLGSGHSNRTNVGGSSASFGIWHEHLAELLHIAQDNGVTIARVHTHIGSGSDPAVWIHCARLTLGIAGTLPSVRTLSLGGGFKVARVEGETSTDLREVGDRIAAQFHEFAQRYDRRLDLEIEPGTYLTANAGALVASVIDVVDTGQEGFRFIKIDSGMTEILRPAMYGAQHPVTVVPASDEERAQEEYIVVGHCCESGDVLTPGPGDPEGLEQRVLAQARVGDALVIGGAGAYCSAMSAKNYNSFPEAAEVLRMKDGRLNLIRARQTVDQMVGNERLLA